jgi:Dolichyl-phosphate-mannose-protein mannosyltransferase
MARSKRKVFRAPNRAGVERVGSEEVAVVSANSVGKTRPGWYKSPGLALVALAIIGTCVYFSGLFNPFLGDDSSQIVDNPVVHSLSHTVLLFEGGTFYSNGGIAPLAGPFYRPLMSVTFAIIWAVVGANPFYFHLLQLLLAVGGSFLLFLIFRYSFNFWLSLVLALIFLVHPIDSQVVFAIASMQDVLFFFFGVLAIWLLIRFRSNRSLVFAAVCLLLSTLSKESGVVFLVMSLLYLWWFDERQRLWTFIKFIPVPIVLYVGLRVHAVSALRSFGDTPIDKLSLGGRLLQDPALMWLYVSKVLIPRSLASQYLWINKAVSLQNFWIPLVLVLGIAGLIFAGGRLVHRRASVGMYRTYLFFMVWCVVGLMLVMQVVPLDMTACETWCYFSMVGLLGMIGVIATVILPRINMRLAWPVVLVVIVVLGVRTGFRGTDWSSATRLAKTNLMSSRNDYVDDLQLAQSLAAQGDYKDAGPYVSRSVAIFPTDTNYIAQGAVLGHEGNYKQAEISYFKSIKIRPSVYAAEDISELSLVYGSGKVGEKFVKYALTKYPQDTNLWQSLAVMYDENGDNASAKSAITNAAIYGQVPPFIYNAVMTDGPVVINLPNLNTSVRIQ